jgi:hypothetical protein
MSESMYVGVCGLECVKESVYEYERARIQRECMRACMRGCMSAYERGFI